MSRWFDEVADLPLFVLAMVILVGCSIYYGPTLVIGLIAKMHGAL